MKLTLIIPTYRRPRDLARCLEAIKAQTRQVDELLIIVRDTDDLTQTFLQIFNPEFLSLKILSVTTPGLIAALNVGLDAASGDIVTFTDDDAVPHPDWLELIEAHFVVDDTLVGLGGRDWVYLGNQLHSGQLTKKVGQVQWFGRVIGNHHLGTGWLQKVDVIKGVNMSFRRSAIAQLRFDSRLRGSGAQVHGELAFCLALKRKGAKIIYDPVVAVNHYPAQRFDEDQRIQFNKTTYLNRVHNETLSLLEFLPPLRRIAFIVWAVLIGTRQAPGFLQWLRLFPQQRSLATQKWFASIKGRYQGWLTWRESLQQPLILETCLEKRSDLTL
ncbi:MAG: glycosyltransferase family 2 protein [Halothece sp.]